jgi:hypothetical protein
MCTVGHARIELRNSKSRTFDFRIEALVQLYHKHGMTLEEFEARILDIIQAAHTTPLKTDPPA